jgi:sirohydrochlorin ferrochelatase
LISAVSRREDRDPESRTGVLLVSHGSHSPAWRRHLLDVQEEVSRDLLDIPGVGEVRTAFMEYTEPSIASQLRAFDEARFDSVVVVPILLTISDHSYDDIPAICGLSDDPEKIAELQKERIEIYPAQASLDFAPLIDFSGLVQRNVARRVRAITGRRAEDGSDARFGLLLVGYGSAEYEDEWNRFFTEVRREAEQELGIRHSAHAWCGHLVNYSREPTNDAIESLLHSVERVILVPVFVAYDPMFQEKIIGRAVERCGAPERVLYRRDSILPDPEVGRWVVEITGKMLASGRAGANL